MAKKKDEPAQSPEASPTQQVPTLSQGIAIGKKVLKQVAPSALTVLFLIGILNWVVYYALGFSTSPLILFTLHGITGLLFVIFGFSIAEVIVVLALATLLPWFTSFLPGSFIQIRTLAVIIGLMPMIPYWVIYSAYVRYKQGTKSKLIDTVVIILTLVVIVMLIPSTLYSFSKPASFANKEAVQIAQDAIVGGITYAIQWSSDEWNIYKCEISGGTDTSRLACERAVKGTEEITAESIKINEIDTAGFNMNFVKFVQPGQEILGNVITTDFSIFNTLSNSVKITYACGFPRIPGKPSIASKDYPNKLIPERESVDCELNISKIFGSASRVFYFNATATGLTSSGEKDILVLNKAYKDKVVEDVYKAQASPQYMTENDALLSSDSEFSASLTERLRNNFFDSRVSANDMVQPAIYVGPGSAQAEQPLVIGADNQQSVALVLFLNNKGKGRILSVSRIHFDLDKDMRFDVDECGATPEKLKSIAWSAIRDGKLTSTSIKCNIKFTGSNYPTTLEPRRIGVTIDYAYQLSDQEEIAIKKA